MVAVMSRPSPPVRAVVNSCLVMSCDEAQRSGDITRRCDEAPQTSSFKLPSSFKRTSTGITQDCIPQTFRAFKLVGITRQGPRSLQSTMLPHTHKHASRQGQRRQQRSKPFLPCLQGQLVTIPDVCPSCGWLADLKVRQGILKFRFYTHHTDLMLLNDGVSITCQRSRGFSHGPPPICVGNGHVFPEHAASVVFFGHFVWPAPTRSLSLSHYWP
jgi:hypothetical protein